MIRCSKSVLMLTTVLMLSACRGDPAEGQGDDVSAPRYRADTGPSGEAVVPGEQARPSVPQAESRAVVVASETDPAHLTDAAGQTLYVLEGNDDGSRCDRACEEAWPPVVVEEAQPIAGPGLQRDLLATMPRDDGGLHVTYGGKPLYRYAADIGAGKTVGHGVEDQWGKWSMVSVHGPAKPAE